VGTAASDRRPERRQQGSVHTTNTEEQAAFIESLVAAYAVSPANVNGMPDDERVFERPLVGFAAGDDPLWAELKQQIGDFYWSPADAFALAFPDAAAVPAELTVVSWVAPFTTATKLDNRHEADAPSERWARGKHFGNRFLRGLAAHVMAGLADRGIQSAAPWYLPQWRGLASPSFGDASPWSERHAAYAAGLGTFGLCDGLITPVGKAMRCGSVVARVRVRPTARPYTDHTAYCLAYHGRNGCTGCIQRCPAAALSETGHDKARCHAYLLKMQAEVIMPGYGFREEACGLCQTGVPCESGIPPELRPPVR
jgi:epoxyqueuosine reductase